MLQKIEAQQLQSASLEELKTYKYKAEQRKIVLEAAKANGGKEWTQALQDELDDLVMSIVDVDEAIEEKSTKAKSYTVAKGTEKMLHLRIVRGRRFNPITGKEESPSYAQVFTFAEWQLFKKAFKGLGYTILDVLHDPYNEAAEFVFKSSK